jgi:DNA polymerase III delta subunit
MIAKDMMENGTDRAGVARTIRLPYHRQEPFLAAARRAPLKYLSSAVHKLAAADLAIKTSLGGGPKGARMQIEMLVSELAAN